MKWSLIYKIKSLVGYNSYKTFLKLNMLLALLLKNKDIINIINT